MDMTGEFSFEFTGFDFGTETDEFQRLNTAAGVSNGMLKLLESSFGQIDDPLALGN
jgi:hypothetical protein